ncbi:aldehyde dehydrogenase family protein [Nocardia testacea]|uniref:aldehyde dehydrogenase family protein n=1 Tax=Nocardia testacea TaxID=248551 RepID=UPI003A89731D
MTVLPNYYGGLWHEPLDGSSQQLRNPSTEEVLASVSTGSPADVDAAVAAARTGQPSWAGLSLTERLAMLRAFAAVVADNVDELARLQFDEMGQPVEFGATMLRSGLMEFRSSLDDAETYAFERQVAASANGVTTVVRHPVGVAAVITPWNFPVCNVLTAIGPLLASGNSVVVKPSEHSPVSVSRLFELAAALPAGVMNLVHGDVRAGAPLSGHQDVSLVYFTGSVEAGRAVARAAGGQLNRTILELGGNDPVVVDADVDPVQTAEKVAFGAFINSGQICTSMERIYVHTDIAQEFVRALTSAADRFTESAHGPTVLGPLVSEDQRAKVHQQVSAAVRGGAKLLTGGGIPDRPGYFYPATVLTEVDHTMPIMTEETFGPVAPIAVVASFDQGIRLASQSDFALAATVYTNNHEHIRAAGRIPAALTWVNEWQGHAHGCVYEPGRTSGMGATGGHASYDAATRPSTVFVAS